jgi:2-polyprenyl-6-methoxyphenol hydroxylase-like FAD-dependent oxidoreductase
MAGHIEPKKILILGGGTAGWMAANLMIKAWGQHGFDITLIEAPDIGIIGVGEGSTPQLKGFMDTIGLDENDWMPACNATYKLGIRFDGWSTKPGFPRYFHPFPAQVDDYTAPAFFYNSLARRRGLNVEGHPDHFFLNSYMAQQKRGPFASENFPFKMLYGYHFDSGLLGQYLGDIARQRGVHYVQTKVTDTKVSADGRIEAVMDDDGRAYEADYFVDCTGFRSTLLQQALQVPFVPFADNLFNDSAVVFPTPRPEEVAPQTISTALSHGWAWTIPLTSRIGNGYVYSSAYTTAEQAEQELRTFTGVGDSKDVEARHLKMNVGRVAEHWAGNCVAVGLSQGFIEPLEATALHLVQDTVQGFIHALETGNFTTEKRDQFNDGINERFEAVRNYIVAHYLVNSRTDSVYWRDNANNDKLSRSLYDVISAWTDGKNLTEELKRQKIEDRGYPTVSWHCLLAGYGIYPAREGLQTIDAQKHEAKLDEIHEFIRRCALNYAPHMDILEAQKRSA